MSNLIDTDKQLDGLSEEKRVEYEFSLAVLEELINKINSDPSYMLDWISLDAEFELVLDRKAALEITNSLMGYYVRLKKMQHK